MFKSVTSRVVIVSALMLSMVTAPAMAAGPDFTALTNAVDFSTVESALFAIGSLVVGVYVLISGMKKVLAAVKSA
ncbi:hypothetical protein DVH07_00040 [Hafnia paralvei]|uniref:hypothetical protein n=1 Tax=Hafnia paralvei TaxID=546367 RepID=UPI000DF2B58A|nr:hypothetical protein [Hafnia paralvei]RDA73766.1 hypothetical protein DU449_00170 [Hafnia paralvei]RDA73776.1 hypothetical protein DVH09_00045 [Hafnia paralvei]RDA74031.1 hypothetical protein DVH08_00095 [Hafnia paralvei]RDA82290.1 hypothetical protein DVH10_00055 [Hafnia paralvei]RDA82317.1 hypothetical protein DVH07_00040 [Hafnia paralvei]